MGMSGCARCGSKFHEWDRCGLNRKAAAAIPRPVKPPVVNPPRSADHSTKASPHAHIRVGAGGGDTTQILEPTLFYTLEEASRILKIAVIGSLPLGMKKDARTWGRMLLPSGLTNRSWI